MIESVAIIVRQEEEKEEWFNATMCIGGENLDNNLIN
jgi:hypothetical protein